ncbi:MAG: N-acetylmuramoyl-L-alanine amidase [bacterium]
MISNGVKNFSRVLFFVLTFSSFIVAPLAGGQTESAGLVYGDSDVPVILPRSVWDNSPELNALLNWLPQNETYPSDWQPIERIVVHDTATPNNDPFPAIARIQSIYRFHAVTNGWGDIGYNYLIDQDGKIYEGRFGGNGSRGAHAFNSKMSENFNYGSIGIALIGSFASEPVKPIMQQSLERLIGWLAAANNLDPSQTQKTFSIWTPSTNSFSLSYSGPVVVGHKNIDPAKSDPGTLNFAVVRQAAAQYKQEYLGVVYQAPNSSKIYQLANGTSTVFETAADLTARGNTYQKIAAINQSQLNLFSASRFLKNVDGSLLKFAGSSTIYLIDGGKKRNLSITAKQFSALGFGWANVKQVMESELALYPNGSPIVYGPDKELLKDASGRVYYIENGRKRWVTSGGLFGALGLQWKKVKDKTDEYMSTVLEGANMSYPSGTLAKASGPTIYLIEDGVKREFLSDRSFSALGYQKSKIISVTDDELSLYPSGSFVPYKSGTLARSQNESTIWRLSGNEKQSFVSAEEFLNLGYQWKNVIFVSGEELVRYASGGDVKYPDGTLVQKKGDYNVYQIKSGIASLIPDAATFKKLKLSWAKVLKISADDFGKLFGSIALAVPSVLPPQPVSPATPTPAATQPAFPAGGPNIRVAIWNVPSSQTEVVFSAGGPYDVFDKNGNLIASKAAGEQYSVNTANPTNTFVRLTPKSGTILEAVSYQDIASWKTGLNYNKFRGNLELVYSNKSGKLWMVNELPLEEYLKGVAETNQGLAVEYLKTMAVAARTYALFYYNQGGKYGSDQVYHITNTTSDQLYKGYGREPYASDIVTAAQATLGEIVSYNNGPVVTAYSSGAAELMSAGSRSACSVWGGKYCQAGFEYLKGGVKDPEGTTYSYDVCGSGNHCVGLSGAGTRRFAALGKTYKEILTYYYLGTEVKKIY